MPSLLMFTYKIQTIVSNLFNSWFGLQGVMEGPNYKYGAYANIKKVRFRAVNFFKSNLKDDYVFVNHDPNKARVSQRADGVFVVTIPVIARALKSVDAPGMPSRSVYIGTYRHNRYKDEDMYSQNVDLAKARAYIDEDITDAERWIKDVIDVKLTFGSYAGTPFEVKLDVVTYQQAKMMSDY